LVYRWQASYDNFQTRKKQQTEVLKSEFWRSTDYGSHWEKEDHKFNLPDTTDQNVIKSFTISPLGHC